MGIATYSSMSLSFHIMLFYVSLVQECLEDLIE